MQAHRAYLSGHLSPLEQPYDDLLAGYGRTLRSLGYAAGAAHDRAMGLLNLALNKQAAIMAYSDVFAVSAVAAFAVVPLVFLFRPGIAGRRR